MSVLIEQWRCDEFDNWFQFDEDCCQWHRDDWQCDDWLANNPELVEDIGRGQCQPKIVFANVSLLLCKNLVL